MPRSFSSGGGVDFVVVFLFGKPLVRQRVGDCCGEGGFAVVNVTDCADVDVRLVPLELFFGHGS